MRAKRNAASVWFAFAIAVIVLLSADGIVVAVRTHFIATIPPVVIVQDLPQVNDLQTFSLDEWWTVGTSVKKPFTVTGAVLPRRSEVALRGWATLPVVASTDAAFAVVDGVFYFHGEYGLVRPDVAQVLKRPDAALSGFLIVVDTTALGAGRHTLRIAVASPSTSIVHLGRPIPFVVR